MKLCVQFSAAHIQQKLAHTNFNMEVCFGNKMMRNPNSITIISDRKFYQLKHTLSQCNTHRE